MYLCEKITTRQKNPYKVVISSREHVYETWMLEDKNHKISEKDNFDVVFFTSTDYVENDLKEFLLRYVNDISGLVCNFWDIHHFIVSEDSKYGFWISQTVNVSGEPVTPKDVAMWQAGKVCFFSIQTSFTVSIDGLVLTNDLLLTMLT